MRAPAMVFLIIGCVGLPSPVFPWWKTGHETVARVAAAHLKPAARTRIARMLEVADAPESVADALAQASLWADDIKNQTKTGAWHFIDLTIQDRKSDIAGRCRRDNCAPARIRLFVAQLASNSEESGWSQVDALRFVVHLVGDLHQPLHTISDADLGGNCEHIDPPVGNASNLHALWDGGIIKRMDFDDKALATDLEQDFRRMGTERQQELTRGDEEDWAWESHTLAVDDVYRKLHVPIEPIEFPHSCGQAPVAITDFRPHVDGLYIDDMKSVVRMQLAKAGLRLARLLNESL